MNKRRTGSGASLGLKRAAEKTTQRLLTLLARERKKSGGRKRKQSVQIVFLKNKEMKRLKRQTFALPHVPGAFLRKRGENASVDVLAFPEPKRFPHPETKREVLGEIYLNAERIGDSHRKLIPFLIHGLLHLIGYDHSGKRDTIEMERMEERLRETIGMPR